MLIIMLGTHFTISR